MGIYDREYYRNESAGFFGSLARQGAVWKWLIAVNVVAFIVQLATGVRGVDGWFTDLFRIDTQAILNGQVWRLLTGTFLHSFAWEHIVFNMLIVWWAGSEVEGIYGPREFLAFYLVSAVLSSAAYVGWDVLHGLRTTAMGASGAATAVLVLFAMHFPRRTVYLFFFFPVPVIVLVVLYVLFDTLGLVGGRPGENIGFAAHLAGAAFGFLYYKSQVRLLSLWPAGWNWKPRRARPNLRVHRGEAGPEPVSVAAESPRPLPDSQLEAELDAVLEKVARHGKSSLTEREHQILVRASEIYRQRRK
jgi:membrane associated rhomboid family serine protease